MKHKATRLLPTPPNLKTVKAANHTLRCSRPQFSPTGNNLALLGMALMLSQASFRADHKIP